MIEYIKEQTKLTCDKCGYYQIEENSDLGNNIFFQDGWSMNPSARKYTHKCGSCNGKKSPVKLWNDLPFKRVTRKEISGGEVEG
jgi:hypothetical protein